ncbi:MAG: class IV adenylate cyclase [Candidatus Daviesbacteria bacterium]
MPKAEQPIEIEVKVQIENTKGLLDFLKENGQFLSEEYQIDTYYSPTHRDFVAPRPIKEWLRLRDSSGKFSINYKSFHFEEDGHSHFCDEYETAIEDIKQLERILNVLDMKQIVLVDKTRSAWKYKNYEIAIDSVKDLGNFVEIEYKGRAPKQKPSEITQEMINFLKKLKCGKIIRNYVGYPHQLLFPDEVKLEKS